jgi:hypothetical protein
MALKRHSRGARLYSTTAYPPGRPLLPRGADDVAKHICLISACENENPNYDSGDSQQDQGPFNDAPPSMRLTESVQVT